MQAIVNELWKISKEVKEMQNDTNKIRTTWAGVGAFGIAAVVAAAFLPGAGQAVILGGSVVIGAGLTVITANVLKARKENTSIETVERLVKVFMTTVEPLKDVLKKILKVSKEFDEKSASLMTKTGAKAKRCLSETQQLQQLLSQTAEIAERCKEVMDVTLNMQRGVRELLNFTKITPTFEDANLQNCITSSALQCGKTLNEFATMRNMLKDFEEIETE